MSRLTKSGKCPAASIRFVMLIARSTSNQLRRTDAALHALKVDECWQLGTRERTKSVSSSKQRASDAVVMRRVLMTEPGLGPRHPAPACKWARAHWPKFRKKAIKLESTDIWTSAYYSYIVIYMWESGKTQRHEHWGDYAFARGRKPTQYPKSGVNQYVLELGKLSPVVRRRWFCAALPVGGWSCVATRAGRDRKSTRLNSSHSGESRMPSSA